MNKFTALAGKKILLGVCGSIAAYKSALLVRLLIKAGAEVRVIMTEAAPAFITPLTLSTLSKNEVITRFYNSDTQLWNNHVDLGLWADLFVIAPASGSVIARLANGICNDVLGATYLSARCPVFIAPAMDVDMWKHVSTQRNVRLLAKEAQDTIIPVGTGELASGLIGEGRMAEPEDICAFLNSALTNDTSSLPLKGKKVLITAGPTREALDPVRFISNRSSGKMGIALAEEAHTLGAEVVLVLGPTSHRPEHAAIQVVPVESAQDMYEACIQHWPDSDVMIGAAAVADYTPAQVSDKKIKKKEDDMSIALARTADIIASLGKTKAAHQMLIGFALETNDELKNAASKLKRKNLDLIVLNSLKDAGAGFQHDTNKITILDKNNKQQGFPLKSKRELATDIWQYALSLQ